MVAHAPNPDIWEAEGGGSRGLGHPRVYSVSKTINGDLSWQEPPPPLCLLLSFLLEHSIYLLIDEIKG